MADKTGTIRADLHFHGTIGLQDSWLKRQGYYGKNLSKLITDACIERGLGMVNLVSEEFEIPRGDLSVDFFYRMMHDLNALKNRGYSYEKLGDVALVVYRRNEGEITGEIGEVIFLNGQCPVVVDNGKRYDHLVVGSNQVPNKKRLADTILYCEDNGLVQLAEHPACTGHFGIGKELLMKHLGDYDAIEGHNAQMVLPAFLSFLPVVGIANRGVNEESKAIAREVGKPYVSSSDAHNLDKGAFGMAYIEFDRTLLNFSNGQNFLSSLKKIVRAGQFQTAEGYASIPSWFRWCKDFAIGYRSLPNEDLTSIDNS